MNKAVWLASALVATVLTQNSTAQGPSPDRQAEEAARARVNAAMERLTDLPLDPAEESRFWRGEDTLTESVTREVDGLVASRIPATASSQAAEAQLRQLLMDHKPEREYSDEAFVRVGNLRYGRSLVAAYTLVRGPHHDLAAIRGYREQADGRFQFVSKSTDFEGRTMMVRELRSPFADEIWFLAWGRVHSANGSWLYLEAFAFDGQQFRVLWRPDPMEAASIEMTRAGFAVTHHRRDFSPPGSVRDEYAITANGPVKITP
jgi:hypothetical protein